MPSARVICLPTLVNRTDRQIRRDLVSRLSGAAAELLRERPYSNVDRRVIAHRADAAYRDVCAHFRSTEALIAECCLHEIRQAPVVVEFDDSIPQRVVSQFRQLVEVFADEPRYGIACVRALMTPDASLQTVREDIDAEVGRRVCAALGSGAWPEAALMLQWAMLGAFANAVTGAASLDELAHGLRLAVEALYPVGS
jgi:AcrR family transcriptional regulator